MPSLCAPPDEKQFSEQSRIIWVSYLKVVKTSEIVRSVIISYVALPL